MKTKMTLPQYIRATGYDECAALFGAKRRTVESWARRERHPRPDQANRIVRATRGRVSFAGIYSDTL